MLPDCPGLDRTDRNIGVRVAPKTFLSVRSNPPPPLELLPLGLSNLAVSQPSCDLRVAWQLGTDRVPLLNDLAPLGCIIRDKSIRSSLCSK
ncbi:hypothetical protein T265_09806 [Opisthorchis viverrini]|uniref:Uncharacterized protein n=1 Tax=Opisthorchis viverrini TaxID=6198 RepID=A0A074Z4L9_OPIVI|nr:hypothetical protein T265_09806 [Opisthorchis viverrini]KER22013.1 hypothetical protein T265_09806 [Opisthorchis viverrini]